MDMPLAGLRWVTGMVVLVEAAYFAFSGSTAEQLAQTRLPDWLPPALGGGEALAALLFLWPATERLGGYALLISFAIGLALHLLHQQYGVGHLIVYGMSVFVCMNTPNNEAAGGV